MYFYNGKEFDSKYDLGWAVFFDQCGVSWQYKPQTFILEMGLRFTPTFFLRNVTITACKGGSDDIDYEKNKEKFIDSLKQKSAELHATLEGIHYFNDNEEEWCTEWVMHKTCDLWVHVAHHPSLRDYVKMEEFVNYKPFYIVDSTPFDFLDETDKPIVDDAVYSKLIEKIEDAELWGLPEYGVWKKAGIPIPDFPKSVPYSLKSLPQLADWTTMYLFKDKYGKFRICGSNWYIIDEYDDKKATAEAFQTAYNTLNGTEKSHSM